MSDTICEFLMLSAVSADRLDAEKVKFTSLEAGCDKHGNVHDCCVVEFPDGTERFKAGTGKQKRVRFRLPSGSEWQLDWNHVGCWLNPVS